ncbi:hypothetical protein BC567DRAFT_261516 [Phyllosticta citribraziliensis]
MSLANIGKRKVDDTRKSIQHSTTEAHETICSPRRKNESISKSKLQVKLDKLPHPLGTDVWYSVDENMCERTVEKFKTGDLKEAEALQRKIVYLEEKLGQEWPD